MRDVTDAENASSCMDHRGEDDPQRTPLHWHAMDKPRPREGAGGHGNELGTYVIVRDVIQDGAKDSKGDILGRE